MEALPYKIVDYEKSQYAAAGFKEAADSFFYIGIRGVVCCTSNPVSFAEPVTQGRFGYSHSEMLHMHDH